MRLIRKNVERIAESEAQIAVLKAKGFRELQEQNPAGVPDPDAIVDAAPHPLEDMDLSELRDLAKEKGISGYSSLKKDELLLVLKDVIH